MKKPFLIPVLLLNFLFLLGSSSLAQTKATISESPISIVAKLKLWQMSDAEISQMEK